LSYYVVNLKATHEVVFYHVITNVVTHMVDRGRIEHAVAAHPDPVVSVPEIVDALDGEVSDTTVRHKMDLLAASGELAKKQVGARAMAWWHTDRVSGPRDDPAAHPDQADLSEADRFEGETSADQEPESDVSLVSQLDLPGQNQKQIDRQQALLAVLDRLDREGEMRAGEIREELYPEHPAGYQSGRGWWKNCISPAMSELADQGRVELADRARGVWRSTE